MRVRIPWMTLLELFRVQIGKIAEDIKEARADDQRVDHDEWRDIITENLLEMIVPLADAFISANNR